ncbi:hypothetical protein NB231_03440 [Nitrococcus mobilis Nb-231]|uniref:Transposase n=1 Tax=Nitrococcus mobilis Nb-231 TaxID=314278 RepID=A4BRC9_9GAMM|nr:hypothetical protein NB231_03440 [Nitrococcus mobilis Nb-231]
MQAEQRLGEAEAWVRLDRYCSNRPQKARQRGALRVFLDQFRNLLCPDARDGGTMPRLNSAMRWICREHDELGEAVFNGRWP